MDYAYKEAYSEVLFILQNMNKEDIEKIPATVFEAIRKNCAKNYKVNINTAIPLEQQNLKEETKAVLAVLYRKFWAEGEEKAKLEKDFLEGTNLNNKIKQTKNEIQFTNSECKKIGCDDKIMIEDDKKIEMIVYRPANWYQKLLKKVKQLLNII